MTITSFPNGVSSFGMPVFGNMGVGNVYNVVNNTNNATVYNDMVLRYGGQTYDNDGSAMLHTTIASALAATVECRNDYVVVWPQNADYDITAALALNKKAVHLICPAGMGYDIGSNNACRIDQTTSSTGIFTITDTAIEVAGFYLKPYSGVVHITLSTGAYANSIHHNFFVLKGSVTSSAGIYAAGANGAWGKVERNFFITQTSSATFGNIIQMDGGATGAQVNHNQVVIGVGCTATRGISNGAHLGMTNHNMFSECGGSSAADGDGGTISAAVAITTSGCAIGNRMAVVTGSGLNASGTADISYVDNRDGHNGGAVVLES